MIQNTTMKTNDIKQQEPYKKNRAFLQLLRKGTQFCSTYSTRSVTLATNLVIRHDKYMWSFVTQMCNNGYPDHGGNLLYLEVSYKTLIATQIIYMWFKNSEELIVYAAYYLN